MKLDFLENMTTDEKVILVEEIWDNIEKDYIKINEEVKSELNRRIEKIDQGQMESMTFDDYKIYLKSRRSAK